MSHFPTNPHNDIQQLKNELAGSLARNLELDGDIATLEQEAKQMRARNERLEAELAKSQVDCAICSNRGGTYGLSQESNCSHCLWESHWTKLNLFEVKK